MKEWSGPEKCKVTVEGPFKAYKQEAWAYRMGTRLEIHANIHILPYLYHVVVVVPRKPGKTKEQK